MSKCAYVSLLTAEEQFRLRFQITAQQYKIIRKGTHLRYKDFMAVRINITVFLELARCCLVNT